MPDERDEERAREAEKRRRASFHINHVQWLAIVVCVQLIGLLLTVRGLASC